MSLAKLRCPFKRGCRRPLERLITAGRLWCPDCGRDFTEDAAVREEPAPPPEPE